MRIGLIFLLLLAIGSCKPKDQDSEQDMSDPVIEELTERIEDDPKNARLYFTRAQNYLELGDVGKGLKDVTRAVQLDSLQPSYFHLMAEIYKSDLNMPGAIESLQASLHYTPRHVPTLIRLGRLYLESNQHKLADLAFLDALKEDQMYSDAWFYRGMVKKEVNDTSSAIRFFKRAVETNSQNFEAYMQLGNIFYNQGDELALLYFNNAQRVAPESLEPQFNLAHFHRRKGDFKQALKEYRKIVLQDPQNPLIHKHLAYVYMEMDSFQKSARFFNRATKFDPQNGNNFYGLGRALDTIAFAYRKNGDLDSAEANWIRAKRSFENAIGLDDQDTESFKRIERIVEQIEKLR